MHYRLRQAQRVLDSGGIIAYPTEAVYGLGCNPIRGDSVARLLALKQRPWRKGLILVCDRFDPLLDWIEPLPPEQMAPLLASWPGPHTWLLQAQPWVPRWVRGQHDSLAVRVSAHPLVAALCRGFGGPLISTSANISNLPPARSPTQVRLQFARRIDYLLSGPLGGLAQPTPIRDARSGRQLRG
ncbi:Sua5/YciO/YrdC/YwlC family protein [Magnetovirga frankeli]|nr:Sua5/YciO/YrdC/YwlC family protein [gamma proteobacterium SS-5]